VYEMANGTLASSTVVRHICDNRRCIRLDHLAAGTMADNARDAVERNRIQHGARHYKALMDEDKVRELWQLHTQGWSQSRLARHFGVRPGCIQNIIDGKTWVRVERPLFA
jgi:hypothetical protein